MSDTLEQAAPVRLNRTQLARALGISLPTVDAMVARGCPVEQKGSNGRSYEFDLDAVLAWRRGEDERERLERERQEELIRKQQLELVGGSAGASEMAMTPEKRRALYDAEFAWRREAQARGELMHTADVLADYEATFKYLSQGLQSLPDLLARKCGLTPEAMAIVQGAVDGWQEEIAKTLETEDRLALDRVA